MTSLPASLVVPSGDRVLRFRLGFEEDFPRKDGICEIAYRRAKIECEWGLGVFKFDINLALHSRFVSGVMGEDAKVIK